MTLKNEMTVDAIDETIQIACEKISEWIEENQSIPKLEERSEKRTNQNKKEWV